ncbi:related to multidrug transporter [Lecanosticta acicola]|uniref:Related to multidrug transporter n=1 Tax=Lecanosticta acicola TaxID=111012 RepID=A0AAI8YSI4_9PEZI|nr:related to multidrug transporter [Lecanosticta acicola]
MEDVKGLDPARDGVDGNIVAGNNEAKPASEAHIDGIEDASPSTPPPAGKSWRFKLAFLGLACIDFVFQFDATALGVALPTVAHALGGTTTQSLFANISYLLCVVVATPIWTSVSDVQGRKPLLLAAAAFFFVGSIVFAVAQDMPTLIAGRVLQGIGGGGINVLVETIVADMTTLKERSFWLGIMGVPIATGNVLGTPLGGVLAGADWRWLGWINLPFIGVGFPLVLVFLRLRSVVGDESPWQRLRGLDWIGMLGFSGAIISLVLALGCAGELYPWDAWETLFPLLLGVALLLAFAFYERYPTSPIVPHRIYRPRTAWVTLLCGFLQGLAMFSILQYLPLFYQSAALLPILKMVVYLLPSAFASIFLSLAAMLLVGPVGQGYRYFIWALWVIATLGTGLLCLLGPGSSTGMLIGIPIIWSSGVTALRMLMLPLQASVTHIDDTNLAIGQLLTLRLFGGVVGLAIASGTFGSVFSASISKLGALTGPLSVLNDSSKAIEFIPELRKIDVPAEALRDVLKIYAKAFHTVVYIMTGLAGLGLLASFFMEELEMQKEELGQQRFEDKAPTTTTTTTI